MGTGPLNASRMDDNDEARLKGGVRLQSMPGRKKGSIQLQEPLIIAIDMIFLEEFLRILLAIMETDEVWSGSY